jgi:hypothetical protein
MEAEIPPIRRECIMPRNSGNAKGSYVDSLTRGLRDDELSLPIAERFRLNVLIRTARQWEQKVSEMEEQLAELQQIVDRFISGLDPDRQ